MGLLSLNTSDASVLDRLKIALESAEELDSLLLEAWATRVDVMGDIFTKASNSTSAGVGQIEALCGLAVVDDTSDVSNESNEGERVEASNQIGDSESELSGVVGAGGDLPL